MSLRFGLLLSALSIAASGCIYPENDDPLPETDLCRDPDTSASLTGLEIGHISGDVPMEDGDTVPITWGGQGLAMVGLWVRMEGASLPSCLAHRTQLFDSDGSLHSETQEPVRVYEGPGAARTSGELWLVPGWIDAALPMTLRVEAYGLTVERRVMPGS